MKCLIQRSFLFITYLFLCTTISRASAPVGMDTCNVNDDCMTATLITNINSDQSFVCIAGCNMYASPDSLINACQMGDFPTVWYQLDLDDVANVMNVEVYSNDIASPVLSVFSTTGGCDNLDQVSLTNSNLACIIGSDGVAKVIGTPVDSGKTYYIAISSFISIGGNFELCVSTLSESFLCVVDRGIEITARSNGGPLEGPFDPNETVSICMNVNEYTAVGNQCQWFQGIVPVFGNGWALNSFDSLHQPLNATINDFMMGDSSNGLYGAATWDWFNNVGYHYDHQSLNISDFDSNDRVEMCNSVYEVDCPHKGVTGGCCGPCWDNQGDILPGGWFAYGINGTCATPGPPISVDWGDGNTCGGGMGPWRFCFDLVTRGNPDCMMDSTRRDLSLGFFTFADGEVGSWTGSASICALDAPLKLSLQAKCGRVSIRDTEYLTPLCSGDTLQYLIEEQGISHWDWNISPLSATSYMVNQGNNGFMIETPLVNNTGNTFDVSGTLIGYESGSQDVVIKKFKFKLADPESCTTVSEKSPKDVADSDSKKLRIYPLPATESALLEWSFDLHKDASVMIYNSHGESMDKISVSTSDGNQKRINTEKLLPGIYIVIMGNTDFRYVTKLVKS